MGFNFKESASKATSNSILCEGRTKVDTDDIIKTYPEGVTIIAADMLHTTKDGEEKTYPVINIAEDDSIYFNGGLILNKIVTEWLNAFNGDVDTMNTELLKSGGVKVKMSVSKTRNNNNIVLVEVL